MLPYKVLSSLIAPLMPMWLRARKMKGKEDPKRMRERLGTATLPRPEGMLAWIHAASVGEANSILPFIQHVHERYPHVHLLLTTGTVTSARLMKKRLPKGVIHQYAPVDTPEAVRRFLRHWKPHIAFWVESELWPNMLLQTNAYGCFMTLLNGRMSEKSYRSWSKRPGMIRAMLSCFDYVFAQSENDGARFQALGAQNVIDFGNIKYDAALLPCNEEQLHAFQQALGQRPVWLAASTHPGEENMVVRAHSLMSATRRGLLTIIVPRHPERGDAIAAELGKTLKIARRSRKERIMPDTQIYLADTLGELGLFYRVCEVVFMGGSLVKHGGQNPLEPARTSCALLAGPHTDNFALMYEELEAAGGCIRVGSAESLAAQAGQLISNAAKRDAAQTAVRLWISGKGGATAKILDLLEPLFTPPRPRKKRA